MKKIAKTKLSLRTETVRTLDAADLARINGGHWFTLYGCSAGCTITSTAPACGAKSFLC